MLANHEHSTASTRLDAVLALVVRGWHVFPLHSAPGGVCSCLKGAKCKRPGKHPRTKNGLKEATTDEEKIKSWHAQWPDANWGVHCGLSGVWSLDFDGEEGRAALAELDPGGIRLQTGRGEQRIFAMDERSPTAPDTNLVPGVDVRAGESYFISPPSIHANGTEYALDEGRPGIASHAVCAWVAERISPRAQDVPSEAAGAPPPVNMFSSGARPFTPERVAEYRSMLGYLDGESRDDWLAVGCALFELGPEWRDSGTALRLWDSWSRNWPSKYDPQDQADTWRSFGRGYPGEKVTIATVAGRAKTAGWTPPAKETAEIDRKEYLRELAEISFANPGPFPAEEIAAEFRGPIAATFAWIRGELRRDIPANALAATLALHSAALGRRVLGPHSTKPQLLIAGLFESGAGKDRPQQCLLNVFNERAKHLKVGVLGVSPYHRAQLEEMLLRHRGQLIAILDEYGSALKSWTQDAGDLASGGVSPAIRQLLGCGRTTYLFYPLSPKHEYIKAFGAKRWAAGVFSPVVTVLGMSTQEAFLAGLSNEALLDGLAGRHLVISSEDMPPIRTPNLNPPPRELELWLDQLQELPIPPTDRGGEMQIQLKDSPAGFSAVRNDSREHEVPWKSPAVEAAFFGCIQALDLAANSAAARGQSAPAALLRRAPGQVAALALVLAVGEHDDPRKALITERHVHLAARIVEWGVRFLGWKVQHGIAEERFAKALEHAESMLQKAGPKGVWWSAIKARRLVAPHSRGILTALTEDPRIRRVGQRFVWIHT